MGKAVGFVIALPALTVQAVVSATIDNSPAIDIADKALYTAPLTLSLILLVIAVRIGVTSSMLLAGLVAGVVILTPALLAALGMRAAQRVVAAAEAEAKAEAAAHRQPEPFVIRSRPECTTTSTISPPAACPEGCLPIRERAPSNQGEEYKPAVPTVSTPSLRCAKDPVVPYVYTANPRYRPQIPESQRQDFGDLGPVDSVWRTVKGYRKVYSPFDIFSAFLLAGLFVFAALRTDRIRRTWARGDDA